MVSEQPCSCCWDASPGPTLLILWWAEGKVSEKMRGWSSYLILLSVLPFIPIFWLHCSAFLNREGRACP